MGALFLMSEVPLYFRRFQPGPGNKLEVKIWIA